MELEQEFLSWTGLPDEPADQIDAAAYAATYAKRRVFAIGVAATQIDRWPWHQRGIKGLWNPGRERPW